MASDHDIGKKEIERTELVPFLEARALVNGEVISDTLHWIESPDFICGRPDGSIVGIELTRVSEDRERAFWDRLRFGEARIDAFATLEKIHVAIERKERARSARYAKQVQDNILVLQLVDGSLDQLGVALNHCQDDFKSHGFSEVWIADYSGLEAFGDVELFCLFPTACWGHHKRRCPDRKPYG